MGFVVVGACLVVFYAGERATAFVRKAKMERRRSTADYPTTANDPVGRTIV